jgi:glycosyltransferase involved in cell wall biosynthesis
VKIAFQIDQLGFRTPGGIGRYVWQLLEAIPSEDPSTTVLPFHAPWVQGPSVVPLTTTGRWGVQLRTPVRFLYPAWDMVGLPPLPRALRGCDVVHITNPAGVPRVRKGQRLVVTVHDLAFEHFPEAFPPRWLRLYRAGLTAAVRRADAIVTPSRATADDVIARSGVAASRVHVTPLAAFEATGTPADADELASRGVRAPYVLFVGTLEPRKNLDRVIDAYRRLAADGLPHTLVVNGPVGWGTPVPGRDRAGAGAGRIVWTDGLHEPALDALYRGADAFDYPSLYEGFGLPVLEALARGVPVVTSTTSSLPEVAGDAAVLVDPTDVVAITEGLRRVLTDEALRADLAQRGPAQAARFSWAATARATLDVYRVALGADPREGA